MTRAHAIEPSPQIYARAGGVLYFIIIFLGLFGELARGRLVVAGDPAATVANIRSSELLWRAGIAGNLIHLACAVALAVVFYVLLKPVSRNLALLSVLLNLISISVEVVSKLFLLPPLFVAEGADYLQAFTPDQLNTLAHLAQRLHGHGFAISLIFFGFQCMVLGYLIFRSGYLPRFIGVLMQVAGLSYVVSSFALILSPQFANLLVPAILLPSFIGETSFALWLLIKGVNLQKWNEGLIARGAGA